MTASGMGKLNDSNGNAALGGGVARLCGEHQGSNAVGGRYGALLLRQWARNHAMASSVGSVTNNGWQRRRFKGKSCTTAPQAESTIAHVGRREGWNPSLWTEGVQLQ